MQESNKEKIVTADFTRYTGSSRWSGDRDHEIAVLDEISVNIKKGGESVTVRIDGISLVNAISSVLFQSSSHVVGQMLNIATREMFPRDKTVQTDKPDCLVFGVGGMFAVCDYNWRDEISPESSGYRLIGAREFAESVMSGKTYKRVSDHVSLVTDDGKPFASIDDAAHLAEIWFPGPVTVVTVDGPVLCTSHRTNGFVDRAMQPDAAYSYYFTKKETV